MLRSRAFASLLVLASLTACQTSGDSPADQLDFSEADAALEAYLAEHGLEGATFAIVHRDYGLVHLRAFGRFEPNRIFLLASSSKVLSAGILMRLADKGIVDVDAPVSTYLSDFGEYKTDITVAQLLSNSAGMVGLIDDALYAPYICQYLDFGNITTCGAKIYTADDAADRVPPDSRFRYGGGQWQLAGAIAEFASGKTWDELVYETYTRPCGLESLGYANYFAKTITLDSTEPMYLTDFEGDVSTLTATTNPNIEGGAYADAEDYATLLLMHLRGGTCGKRRVLSESAVARMQEDRIASYGGDTGDPELPGYGFGWWVSRDRPGILADAGAFGASPWLDLGRGYGAVILVEADSSTGPAIRQATQPAVERAFDALPAN